jgi:hypothetical protein
VTSLAYIPDYNTLSDEYMTNMVGGLKLGEVQGRVLEATIGRSHAIYPFDICSCSWLV